MPLGVLKKYNALGNQDDWVLPGIRPDRRPSWRLANPPHCLISNCATALSFVFSHSLAMARTILFSP